MLQLELEKSDFDKTIEFIKSEKKLDFEKFQISSIQTLFNSNDDYKEKVEKILLVSRELAASLTNGLNGNPRQCKRFLNSMYMRLQMATYKNKVLDRGILAKIMMLEYIKPRIFNKIAEMVANNTINKELENFSHGEIEKLTELKAWSEDSWFLKWLNIEPKLFNEELNMYFYFSRTSLEEKISRISSTLSPTAQRILEDLTSKSDIRIKRAIDESKDLSELEAVNILEAIYTKMVSLGTIDQETMKSFIEFSCERKHLVNETMSYLRSLKGSQISFSVTPIIAKYAQDMQKEGEIMEIVAIWGKEKKDIEKAFNEIMK